MKHFVKAAMLPISALFFALAPAQDSPDMVLGPTKQFSKRVLISGLAGPWELTWGPDNMLWVTERTGKRISRIDPATGEKKLAVTIPEVSAPGGQDGLLGMALHPGLLKGTGNDFVYAFYSYIDKNKGPVRWFPDPQSRYHFLYGKVVRFTYDKANGTLSQPVDIITGVPAGNDHDAGRLKFGPDQKLYLTIGDGGHDQLGNFCLPIEAQRLPTQDEVDHNVFHAYEGKSLRINLDGSVPADNPKLNGVVSHVYTYGHRNPQGIDFGPDGTLYSSEQGPKTDDEINILKKGSNYGWPHVAGLKDNKAYEYARWADATTPCSQLRFSDTKIDPSVPREPESAFTKPFVEPIYTMFTVPTGFNFSDPVCKGVDFICWPTTGNSNVEYYTSQGTGVPGWDKVLLVTTLKRGSLYVANLSPDGQHVVGHMSRYFQSNNRYRDTAISPDRKTIYIATDPGGLAESVSGGATSKMQDPGAILAFTYTAEGAPTPAITVTKVESTSNTVQSTNGIAPQYTAEQASDGKGYYNANCAVCHGNTMTNGTFGPPLGGEYFKKQWTGRTVGEFFTRTKTMPPSAPASLIDSVYADIVAYVLQMNGVPAGGAKLPVAQGALDKMSIK